MAVHTPYKSGKSLVCDDFSKTFGVSPVQGVIQNLLKHTTVLHSAALEGGEDDTTMLAGDD